MNDRSHWQRVYREKSAEQTSWYQFEPRISLEMIRAAGAGPATPLIDVGGGASRLAGHLLDRGFRDLTVLDISGAALSQAKKRLGDRAAEIHWIEADARDYQPRRNWDLWHAMQRKKIKLFEFFSRTYYQRK